LGVSEHSGRLGLVVGFGTVGTEFDGMKTKHTILITSGLVKGEDNSPLTVMPSQSKPASDA
jgi:hypothetical protein